LPANAPTVPPVTGYSEGQEILFIHTEASDPKIAKILTDMMGGSPVLVVPALAKAPKELVARVYVFTNGMTGDGPTGPLGGQADIFEHPPGDAGYRPLRAVTLVTWKDEAAEQNERVVVSLEVEGRVIRFTLVAGLIARRIVCALQPGQKLERGERIGLIRFGSRVDIELPDGWVPGVKLKQRMISGETPIASARTSFDPR